MMILYQFYGCFFDETHEKYNNKVLLIISENIGIHTYGISGIHTFENKVVLKVTHILS